MKRVLLLSVALLSVCSVAMAQKKKKAGAKDEQNKTATLDSTKIHWITWDEAQEKMKKEPKKVWVDIYTDWCGWCKVMDRTTFSNKEVIKYMNEKFYAIKFNPEKGETINFMGKEYTSNALANELMRGNFTYPTFVYMEENFQDHFPMAGYLKLNTMEGILKFLGENNHKQNIKYDEFLQTFTPTWPENEGTAAPAPAPGH